MMASYVGGQDMTVFRSKAGAMSFAILMNTTVAEDGRRVIDYDQTQNLFDFICASVDLPDVERDSMSEMVDALKESRKDSPSA